MYLHLFKHVFIKKFINSIGGHRKEFIIDSDAYSLLTLTHTKSTRKFYFIAEIIFADKILKLLNDLARTFDVAGTSDTNRDFHADVLPLL